MVVVKILKSNGETIQIVVVQLLKCNSRTIQI